jgi:hypothetical protein
VQCFVFILWRNVMMVLWNAWVPIVCANRLRLLHLYFFFLLGFEFYFILIIW